MLHALPCRLQEVCFGSSHCCCSTYLTLVPQFLVVKDKSVPSVPHLLRELMAQKPIGGLAVHWRVFGSSGHDAPPTEGVLKVLAHCHGA